MLEWPDVGAVLGSLPWAVIGAVAARRYMPERMTRDLDLLVHADDASEAARRLLAAGWEATGRLTVGGSGWRSPSGATVDMLECAEPWCCEALAEAQANRDPQDLPILPLPYLVLTKLRASRGRDVGDLTQMLGLADERDRDRVRATVARYAPEDGEDVDALIELGRLETGR